MGPPLTPTSPSTDRTPTCPSTTVSTLGRVVDRVGGRWGEESLPVHSPDQFR